MCFLVVVFGVEVVFFEVVDVFFFDEEVEEVV